MVTYIRGEEGTSVTLTLIRNGETIEVELTREKVDTPTVESEMLDDGIGYLQITEFDDVTVNQFNENFEKLKAQGMKGLIIDLRGNPGGSVTTVCAVAEQLLPEGLIFYMEDKDGKRTEYTCKGADFDLPLVVLVNEYSASASEILAGAVKDAGIGKLVGKKTFGSQWPTTTPEAAMTSTSRGSSLMWRSSWIPTPTSMTRPTRSWIKRWRSCTKRWRAHSKNM